MGDCHEAANLSIACNTVEIYGPGIRKRWVYFTSNPDVRAARKTR
jgi:hypothetical protein